MSKFTVAVAATLLSLPLTGAIAGQPVSSRTSDRLTPAEFTSVKPDVFGSLALSVQHSRYSARWIRAVGSADLPALRALMRPAASLDHAQQRRFVNHLLNRKIAYRFDAHPTGDHWATARDTLAKSAGDCEDFVIVKMQALRALGVPADDLYMTIGHDSAVGAVHAVLLVRSGRQFWVLDNRTDWPIPQESYKDFHPMLTFSGRQTWLHGYKRGTTPAAVRAMRIGPVANKDGLPLGNSASSAALGWKGGR